MRTRRPFKLQAPERPPDHEARLAAHEARLAERVREKWWRDNPPPPTPVDAGEFAGAMAAYMLATGNPLPTCPEVLAVAHSLGYRQQE